MISEKKNELIEVDIKQKSSNLKIFVIWSTI